jgi:hypothetical protein
MSKKTTHALPYTRRTLAINGTVSRQEAQLDHRSALALAYVREWLRSGPAATGVDPLASGAIRRAVQFYAEHLNAPGIDPEAEARAMRACCSSLTPDDEDRQAAIQRLRGHQPGQPFPAWLDVLHGFDRLEKLAALDDRVEELLAEMHRNRRAGKGTTA